LLTGIYITKCVPDDVMPAVVWP